MRKMTVKSMIRQDLVRSAMPGLTAGVVVGCLSALHLSVMFLIGSWMGPFVLWFLQPVPRFLPAISGVSFVLVLLIAASRLSDNWWTTASYDSKSLGEIPLADAPWRVHGRSCLSLCLSASGLATLNGMGLPADAQVFGPASVSLVAKIILFPLLIGPAALLASIGMLRESYALLNADTARLAELILFVSARGGRASFETLAQGFGDFSLEADVRGLLLVDGVVILQKEIQGVALTDRLKARIETVCSNAGSPTA